MKKILIYWVIIINILGIEVVLSIPIENNKQNIEFQLGKHYKKLPDRVRTKEQVKRFVDKDQHQTQVLMFFGYACYWCSQLSRPFDNWALQHKQVKTYAFPVVFSKPWLVLGKAFFTAQQLDPTGDLSNSIFIGMHQQNIPLWEEANLEEFFINKGFSKEKFNSIFHSFAVDMQVKLADELALAFEIDATPNIVVNGINGTYLTNLVMTKDKEVLFTVVDYLVKKVSN